MHVVRRLLWGGGLVMTLLYVAALTAGEIGRRTDIEYFSAEPDMSLWSAQRVHDFKLAQKQVVAEPLAILRVPSLKLTVPVYPTTTEVHLNRGVGVIPGMALPDRGGNLGLAGHRDGFFRVLKDIAPGTVVEVQTHRRTHRYRISAVEIVDKSDGRLLADTDEPTLTLVTCHPFYFVGDAPRRFVVRGVYLWPTPTST